MKALLALALVFAMSGCAHADQAVIYTNAHQDEYVRAVMAVCEGAANQVAAEIPAPLLSAEFLRELYEDCLLESRVVI